MGKMVSFRRRVAIACFSGSRFRRALSSRSVQWRRLNSAARILRPLASVLSCRSWPSSWFDPAFAPALARIASRNPGLPRHQPRRNGASCSGSSSARRRNSIRSSNCRRPAFTPLRVKRQFVMGDPFIESDNGGLLRRMVARRRDHLVGEIKSASADNATNIMPTPNGTQHNHDGLN